MNDSIKTDVFYVTYAQDAEWFRWSLQCLQKNLTGYRRIVVVVPQQDAVTFDLIRSEIGGFHLELIPDWPGLGYYWQQWVKMRADEFCQTADFILHVDSDVFFKAPCTVTDFFLDGLPSWLWAYYTDLAPTPWQAPTERATGFECAREFMQGFPFILHRGTYGKARDWIQNIHGIPAETYIRDAHRQGEPPAFSEFNFLGNIAWTLQQADYSWVDRGRESWPVGFHSSRQFWSHAPLDDHLPEIRQMLMGGKEHHPIVTTRGWWVLSNDTHISKWVEETGRLDFDTPVLDRICTYINPGDTVVDVGAFIGDHTLAYARATHGVDSGRVWAFEPNPKAFACLQKNMAALCHVECLNVGLSDIPGQVALAIDPNAGASHMQPGEGVNVITLDSLDLDRLDFLKIDAEGMELKILCGAYRTISRHRPAMYIEINAGALARQGNTAEAIYAWLRDRRYRIEGIEDGPQFDIYCLPE